MYLDDAVIFDEALSADQIASLADGSRTPLNVLVPVSRQPNLDLVIPVLRKSI